MTERVTLRRDEPTAKENGRSQPHSFRDNRSSERSLKGVLETPAVEALVPEMVYVRYSTLNTDDIRIMEGLALGRSTMKMAAAVHMDRDSVEDRIEQLSGKFGVKGRAGLIDVQGVWAKFPEDVREKVTGRDDFDLSSREREVAEFLAEGLTSQETAKVLGLSAKTVENHRAHLLEKTGTANTAQLISTLFREGILT